MLLRRYERNPFAELRSLQEEMNRLFSGYSTGIEEEYPALNIWSNADEVIVTAELPGLELDDINITVKGNYMSIGSERKAVELDKNVKCHRRERASGSFVRSFTLPYEADTEKIVATYKNGILTVKLPRAESSKAKQIKVLAE